MHSYDKESFCSKTVSLAKTFGIRLNPPSAPIEMKTSSLSGECTVCGHVNSVHQQESCVARGCRKRIKVCGATVHYIPAEENPNVHGWVVCRPCPDHGREGKHADYSRYPVVGKNRDGNLFIVQAGIDSEGDEEYSGPPADDQETSWPQPESNLADDLAGLTVDDDNQAGSSSAQAANVYSAVEVQLSYREGYLRFEYSGKEFKTKPERWTTFESKTDIYYIFKSNDTGRTFYTFEWPDEEEEGLERQDKKKKKKKK